MYIERLGERKRSVIIEGSVEAIDNAPVRKVEGKEMTTYEFRVLVEFDQTTKETFTRSVYCHYYVRKKDDSKRGSEKLLSSLTRRERIICYGYASSGAVTSGDTKLDKRIPLGMNVHSFILPDRINALIAGLTDCTETAVEMEDDGVFEIEHKQANKNYRQSQKRYARTPKKSASKKGKETKKYAFD